MDESHFSEIDAVMLHVEEARARAERAVETLRSSGAAPHLVEAVERAEEQLAESGSRLVQRTLYAVPSSQTSL